MLISKGTTFLFQTREVNIFWIDIIIGIVLLLAIVGSIAAWINTKIIIEELEAIKKHLGIEDGEI